MKKVYGFLASLLVVGLVSAATNAEVVGGGIWNGILGLFNGIQANPANLSTILFGVLIWMVLYSVVKEIDLFKGMTFAAPIVSVILTVLSFIYVPQDIFNVAGANVGALGAIIITSLPIIIAFYFTTKVAEKQTVARVIWGGFLAYYVVILVYTWAYAPDTAGFFSTTPGTETFKNLFYFIGAVVSLLMIAFLPYIRGKAWDFELEDKKEKATRRAKTLGAALDTTEVIVDQAAG